MAKRKRFGEILMDAGVIDQGQLYEALDKQQETGYRLGQILEDMGVVTERDIAVALARQFGFKTVSNIAKAKFSEDLLAVFDGDTAIKKMLFPLKKEGKLLYLAMVNPLDIETIDNLSFKSDLRIVPCITTPSEIQSAVNLHYYHLIENVELAAHDPGVVLELPEEKKTDQDILWKILLVDGQKRVHCDVIPALKREGYKLLQASNGVDGLQLATQEQPHLILADTADMPQMGGYAMFRALQVNPKVNNIPILALSEEASAEEEARLLGMGYVDVLVKPLNPLRLVARTRNVLKIIYGHHRSPS